QKSKGQFCPSGTYFGNLCMKSIAVSKAMNDVLALVEKIARGNDSSVLITGESGTGKEVIARMIHEKSKRRQGPFVTVRNVAETLAESELFGHADGAFTGCKGETQGYFEAAHGGTILLDEVGELSGNIQVKLLAVLQEKEITRIGETKPRKIDVRVIAATNRNLEEEMAKGHFRDDLFYRLECFRIHMPPLRERKESIQSLAQHFLEKYAKKINRDAPALSQEVLDILAEYHWPGNVRQLEHAIEHAVVVTDNYRLIPEDLPLNILKKGESPILKKIEKSKGLDEIERAHIIKSLQATNGNKTRAAGLLEINRYKLYRLMEKYGIQRFPK
ncbi:MAG: sigma-54 dependent transcriptional regulator, partial [bacterium]|nr:sigma-54 dependent transcriptional regulator [bacterium]